eukprot:5650924-Pyramimonas_sp.AAC.1
MLLERSLWAPLYLPPLPRPQWCHLVFAAAPGGEERTAHRLRGLLTLSGRAGRSSGPRYRAGHHHHRS